MEGVVATICVEVQEFTVAVVVPNFTVPVVLPKFLPAIVTFTPDWPLVGPIEPICGVPPLSTNCQTETVWAGSVKLVTGLLPPEPAVTLIERPPSRALR